MKRIHVFLTMLVAVAGIAMSFSSYRDVTQRYDKVTSANQFTKITNYNPVDCKLPVAPHCTYIATFADGVTPPATLPANAGPGNPVGLISIVGDNNPRTYVKP